MLRSLSDLEKLGKLKRRRQVVQEAIVALEQLKTEYKGVPRLRSGPFRPNTASRSVAASRTTFGVI